MGPDPLAQTPLVVLDTPAILALLFQEAGEEVVRPVLGRARISTVGVAETMDVLARKGLISEGSARQILSVGIEPFDQQQAIAAGSLLARHRRDGLSLGDACCLALGITLGAAVYTADRSWAVLPLPVPITINR